MMMDLDFLSSLVDEVALEGLDGITLPMLWVRLQNRPNFPISLDSDSKIFLWECIAVHKDIEIFELPKPRPFVPLYNRFENIDPELGIVIESPVSLIDSYSIESVKDGEIRGSCATFKTRVCITSEIRYDDVLLMNFVQVTEKWGEKLVLVASPRARLLALIGTEINPLVDLSQEEYCLLERVGRSRYHGEVTPGEGGLLNLKASFCKQVHYHRKKLTLKGLMTKQLFYIKTRKGNAATGSLFQLPRFFVVRKTKLEVLLKCVCDALKEKPNNWELTTKIRKDLQIKEKTFKKMLYKPFDKCLKILTVTYKEYNPNAPKKVCFTANGQDRIVKVIKLLKHCDEADVEEVSEEKQFLSRNLHCNFYNLYHDFPLLIQIYSYLVDAGPEGITANSLISQTTLSKLDIRNLLRLLLKRNMIIDVLKEKGRQKETYYIAKHFSEQNEDYSNIKKRDEEIPLESFREFPKNKRKLENDENESPKKKVHFSDEAETNNNTNNSNFDYSKVVTDVSEIQTSDAFTGKVPRLLNMNEKPDTSVKIPKKYRLTYRKVLRMNMVLDYLKTSAFSTLSELQKYLIDKEREEGYNFKIDKKSTSRMIRFLYLAKKLTIFKAVLTLESQKAEIEFICDISLKCDDPSFQAAIEQIKFKFFTISKGKIESPSKTQSNMSEKKGVQNKETKCGKTKQNVKEACALEERAACAFSNKRKIEQQLEEKHTSTMLNREKTEQRLEARAISILLNEKVLQELQVHPKFLRIKTLHKFLFYLAYNYEGHLGDQSSDPIVYHDSLSWKRFVPPLPSDHKVGWCFLADVYNRMPLSIFVRVVNLRQKIREFSEFLRDEIKCNYLITYLPKVMLKSLLERRKYLFSVDEVIKHLCYMGLVTYGPKVAKIKDQIYIYVHRNASVKDTTISTPGYLHINSDILYEKKSFSFNSLVDIDKYWIELENICCNTSLGRYSCAFGKTLTIPMMNHKPELLAAIQHKNFDQISDDGFVPGDQLGAGGFDSLLFLHSRRNWQSSNYKENDKPNNSVPNLNSPLYLQNLLKQNDVPCPENKRLQRLSRHQKVPQKDKTLKEKFLKLTQSQEENKAKCTVKKKTKATGHKTTLKKKKVIVRTVQSRQKKSKTPYLDDKDKAAVEKMTRMRSRCEWSAQEDSFLLLCKVTSAFLDPYSRTLVVPYTVIRDLLHEQYPDLATTKTSRACQRRVRYMMLNATTTNNVIVFLGEAKQDRKLVKDYDRPKPPKSNEALWIEYFTDVLKRLLQKFTLPAADRCNHINLSDSMEMFKKSFSVITHGNVFHRVDYHKDPENEEDLKHSILYALINSAMSIIEDGTQWSYLLYKLYHIYPEYMLKSVITKLRNDKVIAPKRTSCKRDNIVKPSLMSTVPYRFSITFENKLLTKFPIKIFSEAKEFLDHFKIGNKLEVELRDGIPPGYAAAALALVLLDNISLSVKVPDQIILFDSSLSKEARKNIVQRMMETLTDKESEELAKILNDVESFPHNTSSVNQTSDKDMTQMESENKSEDMIPMNEVPRSTNASRFALYVLRQELSQPPVERVQHSQDYIVLNSCQIICNLKNNPVSENTSDSINQEEKVQLKNKIEQRGKILTDGCISEIKESLTKFVPPEAFNQYNSQYSFEECLEMIYDAYSLQTLNDAKSIFEEIRKMGMVGIPETKLWEKYQYLVGELSFFEHLHLFREALLVVRAGIASFVYVCICYSKDWLLQSYVMPEACYRKKTSISNEYMYNESSLRNNEKVPRTYFPYSSLRKSSQSTEYSNLDVDSTFPDNFMDTYEDDLSAQSPSVSYSYINFTQEIYFLPRTWRHPDGTLNKRVFMELMQTILSYIIHSPGLSTSRIIDRFAMILQPVQILELVEILEKACCIEKTYCKKLKKGTLFSPLTTIVVTKNPGPNDLDHLEPLPDAICNLTKIQEAIM